MSTIDKFLKNVLHVSIADLRKLKQPLYLIYQAMDTRYEVIMLML